MFDRSVPLVKILANPEKYHGQRVITRGYLRDQFENSAIYLTEKDAKYLQPDKGLWVNHTSETKYFANTTDKIEDRSYFDCLYVTIEGTFNKDRRGHLGLWAGEIDNVVQVSESDVTGPGSVTND